MNSKSRQLILIIFCLFQLRLNLGVSIILFKSLLLFQLQIKSLHQKIKRIYAWTLLYGFNRQANWKRLSNWKYRLELKCQILLLLLYYTNDKYAEKSWCFEIIESTSCLHFNRLLIVNTSACLPSQYLIIDLSANPTNVLYKITGTQINLRINIAANWIKLRQK